MKSGKAECKGSVMLLSELQQIFSIYAKDLKTFREGGTEFELLANTDMFDIVVKLLNVSDKIKKLDTSPTDGATVPEEPQLVNIQDFALKKVT